MPEGVRLFFSETCVGKGPKVGGLFHFSNAACVFTVSAVVAAAYVGTGAAGCCACVKNQHMERRKKIAPTSVQCFKEFSHSICEESGQN